MPIRLSPHARLVHFHSSDGLRIEGRLTRAGTDRAVVLCHPHPLYGGSMLTPVIMTAEQVFQEAGYTTLAFNFRGVGGSQGTYGEGRAETADVEGGLRFLEAFSLSLPVTPWFRLLETDHFFTDALDGLAQACRDAAAWAVQPRA